MVPPEVLPAEGASPWKLVVASAAPSSFEKAPEKNDFIVKLNALLGAEGKTQDVHKLVANENPVTTCPAAIILAMGEVLEKTLKPCTEASLYKRLRVFSGVKPTPAGEEEFDNCMEQATQIVQECTGVSLERPESTDGRQSLVG